jgi:hypothetical protein
MLRTTRGVTGSFAAKSTEETVKMPLVSAKRSLDEALSSVPSTGNKSAASGGVQKTLFVDLLVQHRDVLMHNVHDTPINRNSVSVAPALRYCFELLDYVIKDDDQAKADYITFRNKETVKGKYFKLGKGLVQKCMDQMLLFEGTTPDVEKQIKGKKQHINLQGYWCKSEQPQVSVNCIGEEEEGPKLKGVTRKLGAEGYKISWRFGHTQ